MMKKKKKKKKMRRRKTIDSEEEVECPTMEVSGSVVHLIDLIVC
jgi:hypothetical protein